MSSKIVEVIESDWSSSRTIGQSRSVGGCRLTSSPDRTARRLAAEYFLPHYSFDSLHFLSISFFDAIFIFYEILSDPTRFISRSMYQVCNVIEKLQTSSFSFSFLVIVAIAVAVPSVQCDGWPRTWRASRHVFGQLDTQLTESQSARIAVRAESRLKA